MNDWPTYNQMSIMEFVNELKYYFGEPLTIENIIARKFDEQNTWQISAGSIITDIIDISTRFCNQPDFDKILENIFNYYNEEFNKVDFIAELNYLTAEQGGRATAAYSGYRPQVKFDFSKLQTSGQQTFIGKEAVFPGEKIDAKIKILSPDFFVNSLSEGMRFEFREGDKIIGTGKIKSIINNKLEKPISYVQLLRDIRDQISLDIQDLNSEQILEYFNQRKGVFPKSNWDTSSEQKEKLD